MLRLPPFELHRPKRIEEAARILADLGPEARLVAGGTDLWPNMKRRHQQAAQVISLMDVEGLDAIRNGSADHGMRIGATALLSEVAHHDLVRQRYPSLARALTSISSPPLRNMGTLGGNLCLDTRCTYYNQTEGWRQSIDYCMKEAGKICWVAPSSPRCWAHSASDSAPMLAALEARVRLVSAQGERELSVADLYRDDGIDYMSKRLDEILTEVLLPASSNSSNCRTSFWKLRRRGSIDYGVLSVAVAIWFDEGGRVERARIFLGSVASQPVEVPRASEVLLGETSNEERIAEAARLARKAATPMDNTDFQTQWRGKMVEVYVTSALREAFGLEVKGLGPRHSLAV